MFVKPGPRLDDPSRQLLVRKPNRQFLAPLGEEVSDTDLYWHKMLGEGDVIKADVVKAAPVVVKVKPEGSAP